MMAKALGCKGDDIMFSSNATPANEYEYARKIGAIINLDDITHIDFLEKVTGSIPKKSAVAIIQADCSKSATILWIILGMRSMG